MANDKKPRPVGMLIRPEEYELISASLVNVAQEAAKHDTPNSEIDIPAFVRTIKKFVVRMRQHMYAGEGVDDALLKSMSTNIEDAFSKGDYDRARRSLGAMIEALVRMDPDPAEQIAIHIAPGLVRLTIQSAARQQQSMGAAYFRRLHKHLTEEIAIFEEKGWDDGPSTFSYVTDFVDFAARELEDGQDPFVEIDEDDTEDEDEDEDDTED